ncbi:unnamed protein product [Rotaria sp. Silwood2]|nr:unnamed protein product [Rotaria sp. Silwood2]CAF2660476.1 unnamed protein product [Rotaria sp. Silwood2]CAF4122288.1 unnamed protein product [Rotaria sp. Silwood2]CAF4474216.1 unnamed protein product [Rotaria sp. Silwood2]
MIEGTGTSTLDNFPDMFVGDMTVAGHIGPGECRSTSRVALEYPNPGEAITITEVQGIPFKKPTGGKCYSKATINTSTMAASSTTTTTTTTTETSTLSISSTVSTTGNPDGDSKCDKPLPAVLNLVVNDATYPCTCVCEKKTS